MHALVFQQPGKHSANLALSVKPECSVVSPNGDTGGVSLRDTYSLEALCAILTKFLWICFARISAASRFENGASKAVQAFAS